MFANIYFNYRKNSIHLWEYDKDGVRQEIVDEYKPYAYIYDKSGKYHDLYGKPCKRKEFPDVKTQKEFVKSWDTLEGDISPECRYIVDRYYDKDLLSYIPKLNMHIVDIEVDSTIGFPIVDNPICQIYLISIYSTKTNKITTFGTKEYQGKLPIDYIYCRDEKELLQSYFKWHSKDYPDVISGWNSYGFDIPYIIERAKFIINESFIDKYSPVHDVQIKEYEQKFIDIGGIVQLDYIDLYKTYNLVEQESYRLDYIAQQELGEKKLKYVGTLDKLREDDWYKYVEYNVKDVYLVKKLHDKFDFITLVQGQAYLNKVPLDKVNSAMRKFDGYLMSLLKPLKIVLPTAKRQEGEIIPGGYVKDVRSGFYKHVATYDYTSLYPSIMFALNLSNETYVGKIELTTGKKQMVQADNGEWYPFLDLENIIDDDIYSMKFIGEDNSVGYVSYTGQTLKNFIIQNKYHISPNGLLFNSKWGFIPRVVKGLFDKRKEFKNAMLSEEKLYEQTKDKKHQNNAKRYDALQSAQKVMCNSAYGVLANKSFRLFNTDFAMAITLTGQKLNRFTTSKFEEFFKKNFGVDNSVIASDTDSFILNMDSFMKKYNITDDNFLKAFTLYDEKNIRPFTEKFTEYFSHKMINNEKNWFHLKKEVVSNGMILVEKKKYAMQMIEKEGVKYDKPKMKIMGMEIVRSSTPSFCREKIKDMVVMLINEMDKEKLRTSLKKIHDDFKNSPLDIISSPRSISNIDEYSDKIGNYTKGCPMQVRAAINFNNLVKKHGLENRYNLIKNGDKIKFIYTIPSPKYPENIIGFIDELPNEFELTKQIDYDIQFEKTLMSPIQKICKAVGWGQIDLNQESIESFF